MPTLTSFLLRFVPRKYLQLFDVGVKVAGVFHKGNNVLCPICLHHYSEFLSYGRLNPRPNALCPNCLSLERHRLIWLYLREKTNFFSAPLNVLHIAPEACFMKRMEKQHGEKYITADIESPLAKVKMDIHEMPFSENHFDVVLCNHVLEHVRDDIRALQEIRRVLKPGGWSILQVPFFAPVPEVTLEDASITDKRQREKMYGQDDHVRKYGKDYPQRITRSGLIPIADQFSLTLDPEVAKRCGVVRGEVIYLGTKR